MKNKHYFLKCHVMFTLLFDNKQVKYGKNDYENYPTQKTLIVFD